MTITEYAEKVIADPSLIRSTRVLKGEFVKVSTTRHPRNGGWACADDYEKDARQRRGFVSRDGLVFQVNLETMFGIASYQIIELEH